MRRGSVLPHVQHASPESQACEGGIVSAKAPGAPDWNHERDFAYMGWVKTQRCLLADTYEAGPCEGVIQAAHLGARPGTAMKSPDRSCGPLCVRHHMDHDQTKGWFRPLDQGEAPSARPATDDQRDLWRLRAITRTQRTKNDFDLAFF
jgi:hypothetical protein